MTTFREENQWVLLLKAVEKHSAVWVFSVRQHISVITNGVQRTIREQEAIDPIIAQQVKVSMLGKVAYTIGRYVTQWDLAVYSTSDN